MIIDSSALIAVIEDEPDATRIFQVLGAHGGSISTATLVEARIVALRKGGTGALSRLNRFVRQAGLKVRDVDLDQADVAVEAYTSYGKGTGHPAQLNYGDTFSYALAYVRDEPLLYVGDDFSRTDIRSALEELAE